MEDGGSRSTVIARRAFTLDEAIPTLIRRIATLPADESSGWEQRPLKGACW